MKKIARSIYHFARILSQRKPATTKNRLGLILAYMRMLIKRFLLVDLLKFNPQHEYFLGFYVHCYSYAQLVSLFEDIFIREEYFFQNTKKNSFIIDGGSHIGMSVLYFKYLYPEATILAFEPDPETFILLTKNVQVNHLQNVTLVNKALSKDKVGAKLYYDEKFPGSVVSSLLAKRFHSVSKKVETTMLSIYITKPVDLLKLDVEGMETVVVADLERSKKLGLITTLFIEYHHHIPNTTDALSLLLRLLEKHHFTYQITTQYKPPFTGPLFQDMVLYAERK